MTVNVIRSDACHRDCENGSVGLAASEGVFTEWKLGHFPRLPRAAVRGGGTLKTPRKATSAFRFLIRPFSVSDEQLNESFPAREVSIFHDIGRGGKKYRENFPSTISREDGRPAFRETKVGHT